MDRAGTVRVRCVDHKQNPLSGITVGFWPNYIVMGDGGGLFCEYRSTLDFLEGRSKRAAPRNTPFHAESNRDGIAVVRSIPADKQSMVVGTEFWTSRGKVWATDQETLQIEVRAGEVVEQTIELHRAR